MKARGLDQPDIQELPPDLLDRRTIIYHPDAKKLGIEEVQRTPLGKMIDEWDLDEAQKRKIKRDANIEDVDYTESDAQDNP